MPQNKTIEVKLKNPIKVGGEETDTITIREPKCKDFAVFEHLRPGADGDQLAMGDILHTSTLLAERLGGLTPAEAGDISIADGLAIFEAASVFFGEELGMTGPEA